MFLNLFAHMKENMVLDGLWNKSFDNIVLYQATNKIECEYLFRKLRMNRCSVFHMDNFDPEESLAADSIMDA